MIAEPNYLSGGDGTISASFARSAHNSNNYQETTNVNELIASCSVSKENLSKLYTMFKSSVFAVAFSITADYHLSEDAVAETFIRLTQAKNFSSRRGDGKGFILTIARNVALELRRRYKKEVTNFVIQSYGEAEQTVEDSIFINQLLKHLNDKQRQTVVLKCCAELTFREIAVIMKCPETTVKSRYKKAMSILQEKAGENGEK